MAENTSADIIDINMGCPVPKVTKTDAGSRWLLDPDKVYEMVDAVTHSIDKPVEPVGTKIIFTQSKMPWQLKKAAPKH